MKITYKEWIKKYIDRDTMTGDFAKDIQSDYSFPKTDDYNEILNYLIGRNVSEQIIEIFNATWRMYE